MAHLHSVYDTDKHFIIDPVTREIDNKSGKIKLMLGDHNSERFTFEIPRTVDGHDMTLCDSVEIHYINIDSSTRQTSKDVYQAVDVQISPDGDDVVIFSWLLSGNATKYFGTLNFRVTFKCLAADGAIDYAWSTDIYKGISVSDGINNTEAIATEYSDILEQWKIGLDVLPAVTEADDGKVLQVEGGAWTAKELPESGGDNDEIFPWAKQELFSKEDLVDPAGRNSFIEIDGVEYYRYHCSADNFIWNNPKPYPGAVTITARAVSQYSTTYGTKLKTVYDDGSNGPDLYVIVGGESRTVTVTTDENKTLAKITGNYDMENWALLDMSVMSCIAGYNIGLPLANEHVPGGVVADPVQEGDTKPVRIGADGRLYTEPDGAVPDEKITEAVNQYLDENGVKSLPDVTEADNGKALQVDNGKWVAKELPESGGSVSGDYIPVPSTAEVGQTIVVKSVDENGKPTEWETADMVSCRNPETSLLADFTVEEDISGFGMLNIPLSEDPFDFKSILITMNVKCANADTSGNQYQMCLINSAHDKISYIAHLNSIINNKFSDFAIKVDLFYSKVISIAFKLDLYQWTTTNQYSFSWGIYDNPSESYMAQTLAIRNSSVGAGSRFIVEGVR